MLDYTYEDTTYKSDSSLETLEESLGELYGFQLGLQNIRSTNKNLETFLAKLNSLDLKLDVLSLTETWGKFGSIGLHQGYDSFESTTYENRASGTAIMIKSKWKAISAHIPIETPYLTDICFINASLKTGTSNNLLLGVCYRSPNSPINDFLEYWAQLLNFISSAQQDTWISGDFNIIMNSNNTGSSRFRTICSSNGFRILDHGPTRTEGTTSNTLDIVITNICKNTTSVTLETGITDHATVISSIDATVEKITKREEENIWSYNEEAIIADLQSETFIDCLEISDLNTAVSELTLKIGNICSNHITQRRIQYKYEASQSQWMTRGILKSLRTQRKLFKKFKKKTL